MSRVARRFVPVTVVTLVAALALVAWVRPGSSAQEPPRKTLPRATVTDTVPGTPVYKRGGKKFAFAIPWSSTTPPDKVDAWFGTDMSKHKLGDGQFL